MKLSDVLIKSGVLIGFAFVVQRIFSRPILTRVQLLEKIDAHLIAAIKSIRLALEKSNSSLLHEIVQRLSDSLIQENIQLRKIRDGESVYYATSIQIEAESLIVNYDEESPFDITYALHQLTESKEIILLLQDTINLSEYELHEIAEHYQSIFLRYQADLNNFLENFNAVNEYRIRDFAHLIWEAEGRPEGQAIRHWMMAVELLNNVSFTDLQLAIEQKRPLFDMLSSMPDIQNSLLNKHIH